jgi:hypothetical protein
MGAVRLFVAGLRPFLIRICSALRSDDQPGSHSTFIKISLHFLASRIPLLQRGYATLRSALRRGGEITLPGIMATELCTLTAVSDVLPRL